MLISFLRSALSLFLCFCSASLWADEDLPVIFKFKASPNIPETSYRIEPALIHLSGPIQANFHGQAQVSGKAMVQVQYGVSLESKGMTICGQRFIIQINQPHLLKTRLYSTTTASGYRCLRKFFNAEEGAVLLIEAEKI